VFDYIPFPIFIHTTGMTHFLDKKVTCFEGQEGIVLRNGTITVVKICGKLYRLPYEIQSE